MEPSNELEQIELSIDQARELVDRRDKMQKLIKDPNFEAIFTEHYFKAESSRLVLLKADPNLQSPEAQADLDKRIGAIGFTWMFIRGIFQLGNQAERDLKDHEDTREEILAETIS